MHTSSHERVISRWRRMMQVVALVGLACWAGLGTTPASAQSTQSTQAEPDGHPSTASLPRPDSAMPPDYQLGSGDHVRITVYNQPQLTGEYLVDGSGEMAFPLIGRVKAGGLTAGQLSREIEHKLSPDYIRDPHVSAEILTYRPFYIVGEVKTPGSYPYVSGMTVLNAIALAGGYTYRARDDSFYVTRNGPDGGKSKIKADPNTPVLPGDIITVRERYF